MAEKERTKTRQEQQEQQEREKGRVKLTINIPGKKKVVFVPKGTKLHDAVREAGIEEVFQFKTIRLNGRNLERNEQGELENPTLTKDSILVCAERIKGGN